MKIEKAIIYKEWIKIRWTYLLVLCVLAGFSIYSVLNLNRVIHLKGAVHIWDVILQRDALFINLLKYIPLIGGLLLALTQFVPEMQQKRLKLTLHLPYPHQQLISRMLLFGSALLILGFLGDLVYLNLSLNRVLAPEMTRHILSAAMPWFLAGIASYYLTAWICLEPVWKRKILNLVISCAILRIFFLSDTPGAYNEFIWILTLLVISFRMLPALAVQRFKAGKQD